VVAGTKRHLQKREETIKPYSDGQSAERPKPRVPLIEIFLLSRRRRLAIPRQIRHCLWPLFQRQLPSM
jgi:hypothetical protein